MSFVLWKYRGGEYWRSWHREGALGASSARVPVPVSPSGAKLHFVHVTAAPVLCCWQCRLAWDKPCCSLQREDLMEGTQWAWEGCG